MFMFLNRHPEGHSIFTFREVSPVHQQETHKKEFAWLF